VPYDVDQRIYRGAGEQHDGIGRLSAPPPWRSFDGETLADDDPARSARPDPRPGATDRARLYRPEQSVVDAVDAALLLRRPLLVTGRPGVGKSTLALSIAWELRLGPILSWSITSSSRLPDGLYRYDALGRLHDANLRRYERDSRPTVTPDNRTTTHQYITLGPLGTALVGRRRPRVLLIDEFDKSNIDLPNDLLNVLEQGEFTIDELARDESADAVEVATADGTAAQVRGGRVRCNAFPIIVITSNGERSLPEAFRRRCVLTTISDPDESQLEKIVRTQLGDERFHQAESIFKEFVRRRKTGESLPVDQLLNAIFLATSGSTGNSVTGQALARAVLGPAPAGDR